MRSRPDSPRLTAGQRACWGVLVVSEASSEEEWPWECLHTGVMKKTKGAGAGLEHRWNVCALKTRTCIIIGWQREERGHAKKTRLKGKKRCYPQASRPFPPASPSIRSCPLCLRPLGNLDNRAHGRPARRRQPNPPSGPHSPQSIPLRPSHRPRPSRGNVPGHHTHHLCPRFRPHLPPRDETRRENACQAVGQLQGEDHTPSRRYHCIYPRGIGEGPGKQSPGTWGPSPSKRATSPGLLLTHATERRSTVSWASAGALPSSVHTSSQRRA